MTATDSEKSKSDMTEVQPGRILSSWLIVLQNMKTKQTATMPIGSLPYTIQYNTITFNVAQQTCAQNTKTKKYTNNLSELEPN